MWHHSCAAVLLPALLMLWCGAGGVDSKPLFGLLSLFGGANRTMSIAETLLANHVQHKIDVLELLTNLLTVAGSPTG